MLEEEKQDVSGQEVYPDREYANQQEQEDMDKCHPQALLLIKNVLS